MPIEVKNSEGQTSEDEKRPTDTDRDRLSLDRERLGWEMTGKAKWEQIVKQSEYFKVNMDHTILYAHQVAQLFYAANGAGLALMYFSFNEKIHSGAKLFFLVSAFVFLMLANWALAYILHRQLQWYEKFDKAMATLIGAPQLSMPGIPSQTIYLALHAAVGFFMGICALIVGLGFSLF
jgi:hypothetical protein